MYKEKCVFYVLVTKCVVSHHAFRSLVHFIWSCSAIQMQCCGYLITNNRNQMTFFQLTSIVTQYF